MLPAISLQQRHRLIAWHLELHPVPCRDIERKHFRVDLRRADRLVSHQALQHLQRDAGIQHVHPVAVTERVRGNRYRKRHPVGGSRINGFTYPVRTVLSVISQMRAFSVLPVRLLRRSSGILSVATIISSWLT